MAPLEERVSHLLEVPEECWEERRVCPDDGREYSFSELLAAFSREYSAEDLEAYWRDAMRPGLFDTYVKTAPCPFLVGTTVRLKRGHAASSAGARAVLRDAYCGRRGVLVALEAADGLPPPELVVPPGDLEAYRWSSTHGAAVAAWACGAEAAAGDSSPSRPAAARSRLRARAAEELGWSFPGKQPHACDLGCGAGGSGSAGTLAEHLAARVVGLDLRADAAEVLDWPALGSVSLVPSFDVLRLCDLGACEALGWRRRFHLIWAFDSLQHLTEAELTELLPALRFCACPGGLLAVALPLKPEGQGHAAGAYQPALQGPAVQPYSLSSLRELLRLSGWTVLEAFECGAEDAGAAGGTAWACALARLSSEQPVPRGPALEAILHFHRRVSHERPGKMADTGGDKDYSLMPDLFARFPGTPAIELSLADQGGGGDDWLAELLRLGLGLTAWRSMDGGNLSCCLRANPSSGGRQPLEAYVIGDRQAVKGWTGAGAALFHYHPFWHALEVLYELPAELWVQLRAQLPEGAVLVGLTLFLWRTVWKYVEVSFNAAQRDTGHAIAGLAYAGLAAGARVAALEGVSDAELAGLLGLPPGEAADAQQPQALLVAAPGLEDPWRPGFRLPRDKLPIAWRNTAACSGPVPPSNADALRASWKMQPTPAEELPPRRPIPDSAPWTAQAMRCLLLHRRSALSFSREAGLTHGALLAILASLQPTAAPLAGLLPFDGPLVPLLLLMVHRVHGLEPGLYALVRDPGGPEPWRAALDPGYLWEPVPAVETKKPPLQLFLLRRGDYRRVSEQAALGQPVAGEAACVAVALAEWMEALERYGAWIYRRLLWEAGAVGQALYIAAEGTGAGGCGLGAFFSNWTHEALGVDGEKLQSVYLFALGVPSSDDSDDPLDGRPAYWHLDRWQGSAGRDAVDTRLAQWGQLP